MRAHLRGPLRTQTLAGRLTRSLILWVGGVWLLCVLGVVWYTDREISYNFDSELVEAHPRCVLVNLGKVKKDKTALPGQVQVKRNLVLDLSV